MTTFKLTDIIETIERALGVPVVQEHAGGTTILWAEVGTDVVLVANDQCGDWSPDKNGPWLPDADGNVCTDGFVVEVTAGGRERFLAGAEADWVTEIEPTLEDLATALQGPFIGLGVEE